MKKIDWGIINNIITNNGNKNNECSQDSSLMRQLKVCIYNLYSFIKHYFSSYELALWIESMHNYAQSQCKTNRINYKKKEIVMADLGIGFGYELSYKHPSVIIEYDMENIFVVPCTSSRAGKRNKKGALFSECIEGDEKDGFDKKTTLKLNCARWISKDRILSRKGLVTDEFFDVLYNKLFEYTFEPKCYKIKAQEKKIEEYSGKLHDSIEENEKLMVINEILRKENNILKYKTKIDDYANRKDGNNTGN